MAKGMLVSWVVMTVVLISQCTLTGVMSALFSWGPHSCNPFAMMFSVIAPPMLGLLVMGCWKWKTGTSSNVQESQSPPAISSRPQPAISSSPPVVPSRPPPTIPNHPPPSIAGQGHTSNRREASYVEIPEGLPNSSKGAMYEFLEPLPPVPQDQ